MNNETRPEQIEKEKLEIEKAKLEIENLRLKLDRDKFEFEKEKLTFKKGGLSCDRIAYIMETLHKNRETIWRELEKEFLEFIPIKGYILESITIGQIEDKNAFEKREKFWEAIENKLFSHCEELKGYAIINVTFQWSLIGWGCCPGITIDEHGNIRLVNIPCWG